MYEAQGIPVKVLQHPLIGLVGLSNYQERIAEFARQIDEWKIELVYGNTMQTFYAIEAAHSLDLPSFWNPRESEPWQTYFDFLPGGVSHRALSCLAYPYKVAFDSNAARQAWQQLNSHHNFMSIHTGLNLERYNADWRKWPRRVARQQLEILSTELAVVLVGTVCERKGQLDLVEALARLSDRQARTIKCFIVGDRPSEYSNLLRNSLNQLPRSRQSRIRIIPETSETGLYYCAADVFVCSSRIESFPRVILEAMAAGLPIITTPVFGIVEQVKENVSALFYPPGDAKALADAIIRLMENPSLRQRLADNAKPALDSLIDFDSMVDAYAEVFREAWISGGTRARKPQASATKLASGAKC
jgi:glycosyltransferase involved in cell wall biosynthesis